jgi:hypothetical protein
LAVLFSLLWEHVGGATVVWARHFNETLVRLDATPGQPPDRVLERRHQLAVLIDFARAAVVTLSGVIIGTLALRGLAQLWSLDAVIAPAILSIGMVCMVAAAVPLFGGLRAHKVSFGIGLLCGLLILFLR